MLRPLILAALSAAALTAAEVVLRDGQVLRGEIIGRSSGRLLLDIGLGGVITLDNAQVAEVRGGAAPAAPGDALAAAAAGETFLEVPLSGTVGDGITAAGIDACLALAARQRIPHVVFVIDSEGAGDLVEARRIHDLLARGHRGITYHALVRRCRSEALIVVVDCDTIFAAPGAIISGPERLGADDDAVLRRRAAQLVGEAMQKHGRSPLIGRALLDPAERVAVWLDETGKPAVGRVLPAGLPKEQVVLIDDGDALLALADHHLAAVGRRLAQGSAEEIGRALDRPAWRPHGDAGARLMLDAAKQRRERAAAKENERQMATERVVALRGDADEALRTWVKKAAEWDPEKGDYRTYEGYWGWGGYHGGVDFTPESRKDWTLRTDSAMGFLEQAAKAVLAIERYDAEAERYGITRLYTAQQMTFLKADLQAKYQYLGERRLKRGK